MVQSLMSLNRQCSVLLIPMLSQSRQSLFSGLGTRAESMLRHIRGQSSSWTEKFVLKEDRSLDEALTADKLKLDEGVNEYGISG